MLARENFSEEHIRELQAGSRRDPALLERAVYAFGLLEAITRVEMPFVFKGGTCLMLLLEHPMRLSTDIDIIVEPNTDVDGYIEKAATIFPFKKCEEQIRVGKNKIVKRHFKFTYVSPITQHEIYILLDVLFEENKYTHLLEKEIFNELLLTEGEMLKVRIPNINCMLGDKLTAFAPHTTGIPLNSGKDLEVMKQMYDVSTLIDAFDDYDEVRETYTKVAESEIAYRGMDISVRDALKDTLCAAASIATRGKVRAEDYTMYLKGIHDVRGHIYAETFTAESAAVKAPKIMYMAACLIKNVPFERIDDGSLYSREQLVNPALRNLKFLKKYDPIAYGYAIKTDKLVGTNTIL